MNMIYVATLISAVAGPRLAAWALGLALPERAPGFEDHRGDVSIIIIL